MHSAGPRYRAQVTRLVTLITLAVLLPVIVGAYLRHGAARTRAPTVDAPSKTDNIDSLPDAPLPSAVPAIDPQAVEARTRAIRRDVDAISAEVRRAASGDWERWQRQTAPQRAALKARLDALRELGSPQAPWLQGKYAALEGGKDFPLFEISARENLVHLYDPESLTAFHQDRIVSAAREWLGRRGIDLIFVPLPKMTEVYIEHFLSDCPPDGIIAPHIRRTLQELLEADVEVVDAFSLFRSERTTDPEYLYNTADTHWAPRAMRIMAHDLGKRLARYDFAAKARAGPPIVKAAPGPYDIIIAANKMQMNALPIMQGWLQLNEDQQRRAAAAQTRTIPHVTLADGQEPPDDPHAQLLLIGHSYVANFREQLIHELNLLIRSNWSSAQTTQAFGDFLREPERLAGVRVVVWVTTEQHMTRFEPLPAAIRSSTAH